MTIVTAEGLTKRWGERDVLVDTSFAISDGVTGLLGANGAGKTTLMNAIMGVLPSSGDIVLDGVPLGASLVEARVNLGLCLVPEKRELFASMTVEDNLMLGAYRFGTRAATEAIEAVFGRFPRLKERRRQEAGTLSGGERQMLAMGRALMSKPRLLMLDEPSLGLAPLIVKEIFHIVTDLRKAGVSILLVEQNARAALQVADQAYVMELGEFTMHGPAAELAADKRVIESYLGLGKHS